MSKDQSKIEFEEGSDNIFADLKLENADELFARAQLGYCIYKILEEKNLKQREIAELHGEVWKMEISKETTVEADGRIFTAVLTPDLEDGGYTVQCQEIPAAISQGETEQEALDNIIDAKKKCLEHERKWRNLG